MLVYGCLMYAILVEMFSLIACYKSVLTRSFVKQGAASFGSLMSCIESDSPTEPAANSPPSSSKNIPSLQSLVYEL